jgi:hypothetical protein
MPLGLAVEAMEPLTLPEGNAALSKAAEGSEAAYTTPGGLLTTTVALPRAPVSGVAVTSFTAAAVSSEMMLDVRILNDFLSSETSSGKGRK